MRNLVLFVVVTWIATRSYCVEEAAIRIQADHVLKAIPPLLNGVCIEDVNHEIYGGLYSQMIFGESFQEPPDSPSISDFKAHGGVWTAKDGVVSITGADGPKLVSNHAPFKDGSAGVEIFLDDKKGENAALLVRVDKPGVGADKFNGYEIALYASKQTLMLGRHVRNFERLKEVPCEVATGRWIALEVRQSGSVLEVLVDGKSVLMHDDGAHALAAGTVGIRPWQRTARYRNLWVKTGAEKEPLPFVQTQEPRALSNMWRAVERGTAKGIFSLETAAPFAGTQSQQMRFDSGEGEWGVENQGLHHWGMNVVEGNSYDGYVWARADQATALFASLESRDGATVYAEAQLNVTSKEWQRLDFTLTPKGSDTTGRFVLKLKKPGTVTLGHAFLQPGEWGRYKGLPVRKDVVEGLLAQGVNLVRYGGSMVNNSGYRWKKMIGPRDRRPPYSGTWYAHSSNGWGIADFMDFCEAAGFEYVPDFCADETPQDMADFIEYAKGSAESGWGRKRAAAGHPAPYALKYIEFGNEERVDEKYVAKFKPVAEAIWAKDPNVVIVVGDFFYSKPIADPFNVTGGPVKTLAGHKQILEFAKQHDREVWFDVHINTDQPVKMNDTLEGMLSFNDALDKLADGARHKVVVFEYNSGNHSIKRALANAIATLAIERDGRVPMVCVANGLQPDGQNDNGWDQGLLFLNPAQVWLEAPGYVTQMFARNYRPQLVECNVSGGAGANPHGAGLDVNAARAEDGKSLVLRVVNRDEKEITATLQLTGFIPSKAVAQIVELSGAMDAKNSAAQPDSVIPRQREWKHELKGGTTAFAFPAHSLTVIRFE